MTLTLDKKELSIPAEGGTFRIKIECKVPVTLERPAGIPDEPVFEESLKVFKYTDINYTKTIEGNELIIVARPADKRRIYYCLYYKWKTFCRTEDYTKRRSF